MPDNKKKSETIQHLLDHCGRFTLKSLDFLEADADVWECPSDPEQVAKSLLEHFSDEELLAAGIVVPAEEGLVRLMPGLTSDGPFIVLRDATTHAPYELLTKEGCLSPGGLAVFEVLNDRFTQERLEQGDGDLIATCDIQETVLLRACGLAATLAFGLEELPLEEIDRFCEVFGLGGNSNDCAASLQEPNLRRENDRPDGVKDDVLFKGHADGTVDPAEPKTAGTKTAATKTAAAGEPTGSQEAPDPAVDGPGSPTEASRVQLNLLGWTLSQFSAEMPRRLKKVVDYFGRLARHMQVDLDDLGLWEGDEETIERLRFIAERRSPKIFAAALLTATEDIGVGIADYALEKYNELVPVTDYLAARARLQEASAAVDGTSLVGLGERARALSDVRRSLHEQVIHPLREAGMAVRDPSTRTLLMAAAELSHTFHLQALTITEQQSQRKFERGDQAAGQRPEDQLKNLLATADRLIDMTKAAETWIRTKTTIFPSTTLASPAIPRLPHSE